MKIERHLCDLCGGKIAKGDKFAMLSVPDFDAKPTQKIGVESPFSVFLLGGDLPGASADKRYEVCRGCVDGLLKARAYIRRAALERAYRLETEEA